MGQKKRPSIPCRLDGACWAPRNIFQKIYGEVDSRQNEHFLAEELSENLPRHRSVKIQSGTGRSGLHNLLERNGSRRLTEELSAVCTRSVSHVDPGESFLSFLLCLPFFKKTSTKSPKIEPTTEMTRKKLRKHQSTNTTNELVNFATIEPAPNRTQNKRLNPAFKLNVTTVIYGVKLRRPSHTPSENEKKN